MTALLLFRYLVIGSQILNFLLIKSVEEVIYLEGSWSPLTPFFNPLSKKNFDFHFRRLENLMIDNRKVPVCVSHDITVTALFSFSCFINPLPSFYWYRFTDYENQCLGVSGHADSEYDIQSSQKSHPIFARKKQKMAWWLVSSHMHYKTDAIFRIRMPVNPRVEYRF